MLYLIYCNRRATRKLVGLLLWLRLMNGDELNEMNGKKISRYLALRELAVRAGQTSP